MKSHRILFLSVALAATTLLYSGTASGDTGTSVGSKPIPTISAKTTSDGYRLVEHEGYVLKWMIKGGLIDCSVSYHTTGWVGIGFSPSTKMKDANIVIGYVRGGKATVTDQFGTSINFHQKDTELGGKDNLTEPSGTEVNGLTTIHFKLPLDSGDGKDRPLAQGVVTTIILAHGPDGADDFATYHGPGGRVTLNVEL